MHLCNIPGVAPVRLIPPFFICHRAQRRYKYSASLNWNPKAGTKRRRIDSRNMRKKRTVDERNTQQDFVFSWCKHFDSEAEMVVYLSSHRTWVNHLCESAHERPWQEQDGETSVCSKLVHCRSEFAVRNRGKEFMTGGVARFSRRAKTVSIKRCRSDAELCLRSCVDPRNHLVPRTSPPQKRFPCAKPPSEESSARFDANNIISCGSTIEPRKKVRGYPEVSWTYPFVSSQTTRYKRHYLYLKPISQSRELSIIQVVVRNPTPYHLRLQGVSGLLVFEQPEPATDKHAFEDTVLPNASVVLRSLLKLV